MQPHASRPVGVLAILAFLLAFATATTSPRAQCAIDWSALGTGMNNEVRALTTQLNGDLVAGGVFTTAGVVSAN